MIKASDIVSGLWIAACVIMSVLFPFILPITAIIIVLHISEIQETYDDRITKSEF